MDRAKDSRSALDDWLAAHGVGVEPVSREDFDIDLVDRSAAAAVAVPRLKRNVCYIVAAVIFDDAKGRVLMVQESKKECYGKWYLPAGRLERGESILDAVFREVKEESGFDCRPTGLLCIECGGASWYRVTLSGAISGGRLKTLAESDSESLQGGWHDVGDVLDGRLPLRSRDVLPLIELAITSASAPPPPFPVPVVLPASVPHRHLLVRAFMLFRRRRVDDCDDVVVLLNRRGRLPVVAFAADAPRVPATVDILAKLLPGIGQRHLAAVTSGSSCSRTGRSIAAVEFRSTSASAESATDGLCLTVAETLTYSEDPEGDDALAAAAAAGGFRFVSCLDADESVGVNLASVVERLPALINL